MVPYVDSGFHDAPGGKKRKTKKGFKCDRRENYQKMIARKMTGKTLKSSNNNNNSGSTARLRSITFDDASRREYLLSLHKKKNERRVQAFVDSKRKIQRENAKTRQQQREEARLAYNSYAKVPILPNYTFGFTNPQKSDEDDDDKEEEEEEDEDEKEEGGLESFLHHPSRARARTEATVKEESSLHYLPAAMSGEEKALAGLSSFNELATVEVKPLFEHRQQQKDEGNGKKGSTLPSADFSDLPVVVEEELRRLQRETKGPSRTKPRIHMLKELEKIRKIKKHSRKGHGKKTTSGKRKNRKK